MSLSYVGFGGLRTITEPGSPLNLVKSRRMLTLDMEQDLTNPGLNKEIMAVSTQ